MVEENFDIQCPCPILFLLEYRLRSNVLEDKNKLRILLSSDPIFQKSLNLRLSFSLDCTKSYFRDKTVLSKDTLEIP